MHRITTKLKKAVSRCVLFVLALYVSGFGCVICCTGMCTSDIFSQVVETDTSSTCASSNCEVSTPDSEEHSCCSSAEEADSDSEETSCCSASGKTDVSENQVSVPTIGAVSSDRDPATCCFLFPGISTEEITPPRTSDTPVVDLLANEIISTAVLPSVGYSTSKTFFQPNRGHTYLRCCVFLI